MRPESQYLKNLQEQQKDWWAAVWRGLVFDSNGTHYKNLRSALWLYLYLIIHAKRETGRLSRLYSSIADDMGIPERTIRNWMKCLKRYEYIEIEMTGRAMVIHICKWKTWKRNSPSGKNMSSTGKTLPV